MVSTQNGREREPAPGFISIKSVANQLDRKDDSGVTEDLKDDILPIMVLKSVVNSVSDRKVVSCRIGVWPSGQAGRAGRLGGFKGDGDNWHAEKRQMPSPKGPSI